MSHVKIFLKGLIIGVANIIPGVSGGTLALILGLFERLISGIHNISFNTVIICLKLFTFKKEAVSNFKKEMEKIDFVFLAVLFSGALASIFLLASLMSYVLEKQHDPTYGFFFGLILASVLVPYKLIKKKTPAVFIALIIAVFCVASTSFFLSNEKAIAKEQVKYELQLSNSNTTAVEYSLVQALILFFAGAIAVSAMILPGISGSFLLLLMGQYFIILKAISDFNLLYIASTGLGITIGLVAFTKLLNYLLKNFHDITMGFLTGLVAGSLYVIWPFRETVQVGTSAVEGYPVTVYLNNIIPRQINASLIATIVSCAVGFITIVIMLQIEKRIQKA